MPTKICLICGENKQCSEERLLYGLNNSRMGYSCHCKTFNRAFIIDEMTTLLEEPQKSKVFNLITEYIIQYPHHIIDGSYRHWQFYCDENKSDNDNDGHVYVSDMLRNYPLTLIDKINRALVNLTLFFPNYGERMSIDETYSRILFCESGYDYKAFINFMTDFGYIKNIGVSRVGKGSDDKLHTLKILYQITIDGWKKIDDLKTKHKEINQGFIAMSFSADATSIMKIFEKCIGECGYKPHAIINKEHNNQIVPEIFYEIERSKFVVVDVTFPNYGAYYEAGYAQALGKQVIVCCSKKKFESDDYQKRPHFDIAQKAMIIWEDEDELKKRLIRRITATVK